MRKDHLEETGFRKLQKKDLSTLRNYYNAMEKPYASSIALFSIYSWSHSLPAYYHIADDYLIFLVYDRLGKRWVFLPPIGKYGMDSFPVVLEKICHMAQKLEIPLVFTDVSDWMLPYFRESYCEQFEVIRDRDLSEYIYDADVFLQYQNRQRERYNNRYFRNKYHPRFVEVDGNYGEECKTLIEKVWCPYHSCEECEYGCQKETILAAMEIIDDSSVRGAMIFVQEKLIAYLFLSIEKERLVFHFKKNERGYRGLNEYIHRECVERFAGELKKINYTEDMGVEGLRNYKQNLCPFRLENKLELRMEYGRK